MSQQELFSEDEASSSPILPSSVPETPSKPPPKLRRFTRSHSLAPSARTTNFSMDTQDAPKKMDIDAEELFNQAFDLPPAVKRPKSPDNESDYQTYLEGVKEKDGNPMSFKEWNVYQDSKIRLAANGADINPQDSYTVYLDIAKKTDVCPMSYKQWLSQHWEPEKKCLPGLTCLGCLDGDDAPHRPECKEYKPKYSDDEDEEDANPSVTHMKLRQNKRKQVISTLVEDQATADAIILKKAYGLIDEIVSDVKAERKIADAKEEARKKDEEVTARHLVEDLDVEVNLCAGEWVHRSVYADLLDVQLEARTNACKMGIGEYNKYLSGGKVLLSDETTYIDDDTCKAADLVHAMRPEPVSDGDRVLPPPFLQLNVREVNLSLKSAIQNLKSQSAEMERMVTTNHSIIAEFETVSKTIDAIKPSNGFKLLLNAVSNRVFYTVIAPQSMVTCFRWLARNGAVDNVLIVEKRSDGKGDDEFVHLFTLYYTQLEKVKKKLWSFGKTCLCVEESPFDAVVNFYKRCNRGSDNVIYVGGEMFEEIFCCKSNIACSHR